MSATISSVADQIDYGDLYARWEKGNWSATEIDFSVDREQWREVFTDQERRAALWNYSLFFHGEDSVADNLSPYIDAAPREEQKYFLTTQQVDEARHAVFFARFMREVVEVGGDDVAGALRATQPELTWGFRKVFGRLDRMADELRRDGSKPRLAAAVTLYHLIVESTLAQPGQHFIERYLEERDLLPGFRAGMRNVALDEQRHIAFGVKIVSELVREDPACRDAIGALLREVLPWTAAVFVPPGWDRSYTECFGFTLEEIYTEGATSMEAKLRAAGLPLEEIPGIALPLDLPPRERAERGLALLRAGVLGEKEGPPARDPETAEIVFDSVRRSIVAGAVPGPGPRTLQWEFSDFEPWHVTVDNGATTAARGRAERPDLTFRCRWEDWIDVMARRADPRRLVATGRLRPWGSPRMLLSMPRIFG